MATATAVVETSHIEDIEAAVEKSRWLLALGPDWDGDGSPAFDRRTWETATRFLIDNARELFDGFGKSVSIPRILPGPNGSIDLHWKNSIFELLINFPPAPKSFATFYGDDYGGLSIKGTLDPKASNPGLLIWLAKHI